MNSIFRRTVATTTRVKGRRRRWNDQQLQAQPQLKLKLQRLSSSSASSSTTKAFNRRIKNIQKSNTTHHIPSYSYFQQEIASRLIDRLDDIVRDDGFPLALDVGSGCGFLLKEICKDDGYEYDGNDGSVADGYPNSGGIGGVRKLVMMDSSDKVLHYGEDNDNDNGNDNDNDNSIMTMTEEEKARCSTYKLLADEEQKLPFPDGTFDLVLSSTSMHWVNDLPSLWSEINRVLKPDGCFLFAMVGGGATLHELSSSLSLGELEREGGMSPHVGPFVDFSDVGSLLSAAGFNLTTVDVDTVKLAYPNAMVLMEHLQRMGENNACLNKRPFVSVDTFLAASCVYDQMYPLVDDGDGHGSEDEGSVEATVQIIYGIGWAPHDSQPKPKERGSAKHKVGDVVVDETKSQK